MSSIMRGIELRRPYPEPAHTSTMPLFLAGHGGAISGSIAYSTSPTLLRASSAVAAARAKLAFCPATPASNMAV